MLLDERDRAVSASLAEARAQNELVVEGLKATIAAQGEELEQLKKAQELQAVATAAAAAAVSDSSDVEGASGTFVPGSVSPSRRSRPTMPQRSGSYEYADDDEEDGEPLHGHQHQQVNYTPTNPTQSSSEPSKQIHLWSALP